MADIKKMVKNIRPEFNFEESDDFIKDGLLDSFDIVTLVSDLDEAFHISIDGLDIIPENFCSFAAVEEVVRKNGGNIMQKG